jgi:formate hydrogenlyase transcriptional activator
MQTEHGDSDRDRAAAIDGYHILDTPPEPAFDDLARLAAQACGTPTAVVSFVTSDRQWFKARVGFRVFETPLDVSFCAVAITQPDVLVVHDTLADQRFRTNPLVTGEPHVRFYAGAPLITSGGQALGTVCVLDSEPRYPTAAQMDALRAIARQVISQLELRRARAVLEESLQESAATQEALRLSEEFTRRILDSSLDCIKVLDLDGRLLSMNEGGMRALDICDFAPFCGSQWPDLWPAESQAIVRRAVETARSGGIDRFAGFCPTANGTPKWWDVAVSAVLDREGRPERILAVSRDITTAKRNEQLLQSITEGTAAATGDAFFTSLVKHLATALQVRHVFIAECLKNKRARSRAHWSGQGFGDSFEYDLVGTPCMGVVDGSVCCYSQNLQQLFPADVGLVAWEAQSYVGVPLLNSSREVIGHLVVIDDKPMAGTALWVSVLQTFAGRAGAELERQLVDEKLREAMAEVERLKNQLQAENVYLQEEIHREHNFEEMVGNSPALLEALRKVERVAPTDATVLILGETGTGKELFARAIHRRSKRSDRPLVKVNCGAIAPGLVESELFGHVKGAFTGAIEKRVGRFELANGGTIFLDEVGELPLDAQVKLLRVLQEQEFEPVGSSRTVKVNVRVIAATNRNLDQAVAEDKFRADLLYRLNVFPIDVPALRERKSDLALLVSFFAAGLARKLGKPVRGFSAQSIVRMTEYAWPGNIRELQNVVERAAILAQGPLLDLTGTILGEPAVVESVPRMESDPLPASGVPIDQVSLDEVQRLHILSVLKQTGGVIEGSRGAATVLGLHPNTLRSRMKKLGIATTSSSSA